MQSTLRLVILIQAIAARNVQFSVVIHIYVRTVHCTGKKIVDDTKHYQNKTSLPALGL